MIFYWLDSFTQCLPLFFHQAVGSNLTSCTAFFITFYANLTKWPDGLTGWPGTVSMPACRAWARFVAYRRRARAGPPFDHLYAKVCFGTWRLVSQNG
jgi:hypothetical protein